MMEWLVQSFVTFGQVATASVVIIFAVALAAWLMEQIDERRRK